MPPWSITRNASGVTADWPPLRAAEKPQPEPNEFLPDFLPANFARRAMTMTWTRIATAAVLIPAVVAVVWWGPTGLVAALAALITGLALLEFFALAERAGPRAYRLWTLVCSATVFFAQWAAVQARSWTLGRA